MNENPKPKFHFPQEVTLERNSLIEAWLEIKWDLEESNIPNFFVDKSFPFALGVFFDKVKDRYPFSEELDSSKAPEGMLPNVPQYRFRTGKDRWPLLQLGPGIATLNLTKPYSWTNFKKESLYLRSQLLSAYRPKGIKVNSLLLKYRNAYPCNCSSGNLQTFLAEKLNTTILLPKHIPGEVSEIKTPIAANLLFNFNLFHPKSIGTVRIATGENREKAGSIERKIEVVVWEFEIFSHNKDVPNFDDPDEFSIWLEKAHSVIHEWYLSSIQGSIHSEFVK